jgi:glutathione peroxidase
MKKFIPGLMVSSALSLSPLAYGAKPAPKPSSKPTAASEAKTADSVHAFKVKDLNGKEVSLADYRGKALLIVNTASKCGFTKQYAGLQKLQDEFGPQGLQVLGFPSNDFGHQEPGTADEIKKFCELNYKVKFPLFEKASVSGADRQPLYTWLVGHDPANSGKEVAWNFEKFLISKDGKVLQRFVSKVEPQSPELTSAIDHALK